MPKRANVVTQELTKMLKICNNFHIRCFRCTNSNFYSALFLSCNQTITSYYHSSCKIFIRFTTKYFFITVISDPISNHPLRNRVKFRVGKVRKLRKFILKAVRGNSFYKHSGRNKFSNINLYQATISGVF